MKFFFIIIFCLLSLYSFSTEPIEKNRQWEVDSHYWDNDYNQLDNSYDELGNNVSTKKVILKGMEPFSVSTYTVGDGEQPIIFFKKIKGVSDSPSWEIKSITRSIPAGPGWIPFGVHSESYHCDRIFYKRQLQTNDTTIWDINEIKIDSSVYNLDSDQEPFAYITGYNDYLWVKKQKFQKSPDKNLELKYSTLKREYDLRPVLMTPTDSHKPYSLLKVRENINGSRSVWEVKQRRIMDPVEEGWEPIAASAKYIKQGSIIIPVILYKKRLREIDIIPSEMKLLAKKYPHNKKIQKACDEISTLTDKYSKKDQAQLKNDDNAHYCEVCMNTDTDHVVQLSCSHSIHTKCYHNKFIHNLNSENAASITQCLKSGCDGVLSKENLVSLIKNDNELVRLQKLIVRESGVLIFCPKCGVHTDINETNEDEKKDPFRYCKECEFYYCKECGNIAHPGMTCGELSSDIDFLKFLVEDNNTGHYGKCPKCKATIEKNGGCDSMTCGKDDEASGNVKKERGCGYRFRWGNRITIEEYLEDPSKYQDHLEKPVSTGDKLKFLDKNEKKDLFLSDVAEGKNLEGWDLRGLDLQDIRFRRINLDKVKIDKFQLQYLLKNSIDVKKFNLKGMDLTGMNFTAEELLNFNLNRVKIDREQLKTLVDYIRSLNYSSADSIILHGINLSFVDISGLDLSQLSFKNVNFFEAILDNTNIKGSDFRSARGLSEEQVLKSKGYHKALFGTKIVNLKNKDISNENLSLTDLLKIDLKGIKISRVQLETLLDHIRSLEGDSLDSTILHGINLSFLDLSDLDLSNMSLRDVFFTGTILDGANIKDADFTGAIGLTKNQILSANDYKKSIFSKIMKAKLHIKRGF